MSKEEKALTVKQEHAVANEMRGMFDGELVSSGSQMDAEDLRIPKLTLIQGMTKAAFNTKGVGVGKYINSLEKNDMGEQLDMFVMNDTKLWQFDYEVKVGDKIKKEYLTITDYGPYSKLRENWNAASLPPEVVEKMKSKDVKFEQLLKPDLIYRFYILLVEEVVAGVAFPYIVDFKRSSAPAGNQLKNNCYKMFKQMGLPSYAKVFTLTSALVQGEHDYYIKEVSAGRNIVKEEVKAVENWVREMMNNSDKYVADESDITEAEDTNTFEAEAAPVKGQPKF